MSKVHLRILLLLGLLTIGVCLLLLFYSRMFNKPKPIPAAANYDYNLILEPDTSNRYFFLNDSVAMRDVKLSLQRRCLIETPEIALNTLGALLHSKYNINFFHQYGAFTITLTKDKRYWVMEGSIGDRKIPIHIRGYRCLSFEAIMNRYSGEIVMLELYK